LLGILCFAWIALGSWVAIFPGTLDHLLGLDYDFDEIWGVSQGVFELFTLGTLAALGVLGAVGYVRAKAVRTERSDADPHLVSSTEAS
jgi:hypothetical protein